MNGDIDRIAVALLRKLKPEAQAAFLTSPEFQGLPDADRNRLYELDAALAETERQQSRQR